MAQQTRAGTIFANDTTVGTIAWTSPEKVASSNDDWASASLAKGVISYYLKVTGFGFSIPDNCIINWVKVTVERHATNTLIQDYSVKLIKGGTIQGTDKPTATGWPASDISEDHGGTDKWGLTLLYSDVNADNFGCVISAKNYKATGTGTYIGYIDYITITIDYALGKSLSVITQNVVSFSSKKILEKLFEYCNTGDTGGYIIYLGTNEYSQTFTPVEDHTILYVKLKLKRLGSPGNVKISLLYVNSSGLPCVTYPIQEQIFDASTLATTYQWITFNFTNLLPFSSGIMLAVRIEALGGNSTNYTVWAYRNTSGYSDGYATTDTTKYPDSDFMFEVWGISAVATHWYYIANTVYIGGFFKHSFIIDVNGNFHVVYNRIDTTNHCLCYAKSIDKGKTWTETIIATYAKANWSNVYPSILVYSGYLYVIAGVIDASITNWKLVEFNKILSDGIWSGETIIESGVHYKNFHGGEVVGSSIVITGHYTTTMYYSVYTGSWSNFSSFLVESNAIRYPSHLIGNFGEERLFYDFPITFDSPLKEIDYSGSWGTPTQVLDTDKMLSKPFGILVNGVMHLFFVERQGSATQYKIGYIKEIAGGWSAPIYASDIFYILHDDSCYIRVLYRQEDGNFDVVFSGKQLSTGQYLTYYYQFNGSAFSSLYQLFVGSNLCIVDCFAEGQERYFTCRGLLNNCTTSGYWIFNLKMSNLFVGGQTIPKLLQILMVNLLHLAKCKPIKRCMSFNQFMRNSRRVS